MKVRADGGVLVASDLDRTLIYSRVAVDENPVASEVVCVEHLDGEPQSYLTRDAARLLADLAVAATFVPVTTRIVSQYRRVLLPGPQPEFAIAANGGALLVDGVADAVWDREVRRAIATAASLDEVWQHAGRVAHPDFTSKLRNADDLFCYAVLRPGRVPSGFVAETAEWAAARGWRTSLQGRKIYWVPAALTKSAAVAEVARRTDAASVIAAGDSLLDIDLLLAADRAIRPAHGELHDQNWSAPHLECTQAVGIAAGTEIARWFTDTVTAL